MSTTCSEFNHHQRVKRIREKISTSDIRSLTNNELKRILKLRKIKIPPNPNRATLIKLLRSSEDPSAGYSYADKYWKSPIGLKRRIDSLAGHYTYRLVNNAVRITSQTDPKTRWLTWITAADDRVCPLCAPLHLRRYRPWWFLPEMPRHVGCRCTWQLTYKE